MKKIKVVIFDFDGVIADTLPFTFKKVSEIAKKLKIKNFSDEKLIESLRRKSYQELLKEVGARLVLFKIPQIILMIKKAQEELYGEIDKIPIFPGIKKLIRDLKKKGYQLALLSSNLEKNVFKFLENNKLKDFFEKINCGSYILGKDKAMINFLKKNGWKREEVIYIGDEIRDVEAMKKSGVKIIGVSWGLAGEQALKKYGVDFLVHKPSEILKIISS